MPKVVIDLPEEFLGLIAQMCMQEGITQVEFFLRAVDTFLSNKGFRLEQSVDWLLRTRAIETQNRLSDSDTDYDSDSIQEIMRWRRNLVN